LIPMTDQKAAWGYVRLSQTGREASLEEQKKSIREYGRDHDLDLQTTRNDGDRTSGFNTDREEYQLVREKIRNGEIDAVVVRDRARLSRDFDDRLQLISEFRASGVEWHVVEAGGRLHLEDVQCAGMECIHAMMDHTKKMIEIERARDAVAERMDSDFDHGRPRFGMQYDDAGEYQVPGEDFDVVRRIFELRDAGATLEEVTDEVSVSKRTVTRVLERREWYLDRAATEVKSE
jgi:DNA invertase Pin-like site-specific DNA recombinase